MDQVEEIKSRLNLVDVISGYIKLTPAGGNFKALCPFHNEKSPSFMVSREKQIWKCFGCGKGGDMYDFVMEMEGVEFKEALRILAGKAGVELKREDPRIAGQRNKLLDCLDAAARFYHQVLMHPAHGKESRDYLKKRNLTEETIEMFKLGYAPNAWDQMYHALRKKGFYDKDMESAGLTIKKQRDYYDRFRHRIMFPIKDINGNVIAFSGRALDPKESAKYINSPETGVFDKSRVLYALDQAKLYIRKEDLAIVVEGQMDIIQSHQAGIKNVIASSGTALTMEQITIIKRYTNNIALSFDTDEAGKKAARRAVEIALQKEMNVKLIRIPGGKDPDECIKNNPEDWKKAIIQAESFLEYYFHETFASFDASQAEDKKKIAKILLPLLNKINDKVEQDHYLKKLANSLAVSEAILREILVKMEKKTEPKKQAAPYLSKKDKFSHIAERVIFFGMMYYENFSYIVDHLSPEFVLDQQLNLLYRKLIIYYNNEWGKSSLTQFNVTKFYELLAPEEKSLEQYLNELWLYGEREIMEFKNSEENFNAQKIKMEIQSGILKLKEEYYKKRLSTLQLELSKAEKDDNKEKIWLLFKEINGIMSEIGRD